MAQQGMTPQQQRHITVFHVMANGPPDSNAAADMEEDLSSEDSLDLYSSDQQSGKTSAADEAANPTPQAIRNTVDQPTTTRNSMGRTTPSLMAQGAARQESTPPGSMPPPGLVPTGSSSVGSLPPGVTPPTSIAAVSISHGSMPPGSRPLGSIPRVSKPPGSKPPGSIGKGGQMSRGPSVGRGQGGPQGTMIGRGSLMTKGSTLQGATKHVSLAQGPRGPSFVNRGPMTQGKQGQGSLTTQTSSVSQSQLIQGQPSHGQMASRQMGQGAMSPQMMNLNPDGSPSMNPTAADMQAMESMHMYWQTMFPSGDFPNFMNMMVPPASMPPVPFLYMLCPPTPGGSACPSSLFYYNWGGEAAAAGVRQERSYETGEDSREGPCVCDPQSEAESRESQEDRCRCDTQQNAQLRAVLRENYDSEFNSSFDSRPGSERVLGAGPRLLSGASLDAERCLDKCVPGTDYFCRAGAVADGYLDCSPGPCPPPGVAVCGKCGFQGVTTARLGAGGSSVTVAQNEELQMQQQQTQQQQQMLQQQTQQQQMLQQQMQQQQTEQTQQMLQQQTQQMLQQQTQQQQQQQKQQLRVYGAGRGGVRGAGQSSMPCKRAGARGRRGASPTATRGGGGGGTCSRAVCPNRCPNRSPADGGAAWSPGGQSGRQQAAQRAGGARTVQYMGDQGAGAAPAASRYPTTSQLQQSLSQIRVPPIRPVSEAKDTESMRLRLGDLSPGEDIVYHLHCKATDDSGRRPFVTKVIPCDDPLAYALNDAAREVAEYRRRIADMELTPKGPLTPLTSSLSEIPMASPGGPGTSGVFPATATSSDTCCINCCPNADEMCNVIRSVAMTGGNMAPLLGRQRGGGGGEEGADVSPVATVMRAAGRVAGAGAARDAAMGTTSSCPARVTVAAGPGRGAAAAAAPAAAATSGAAAPTGGGGGARKAGPRRPTPQQPPPAPASEAPAACRCRKARGPATAAGPGGAAPEVRPERPPKAVCCRCTPERKASQPSQPDRKALLEEGRRGAKADVAAHALKSYLQTPEQLLEQMGDKEKTSQLRRRPATPDAAADAIVTLIHSRVPSLIALESEKEIHRRQRQQQLGRVEEQVEQQLEGVAAECVAACCPCVDVVASGVRCVCHAPDECCICETQQQQQQRRGQSEQATAGEVAPDDGGGASGMHSQHQVQKAYNLPRQR